MKCFLSNIGHVISIIALILSIISFIKSSRNEKDLDKKWHALNSSNPELKEIKMISFKELTTEEAKNTNWGHNAYIFKKEETDLFYMPYHLSLVDKLTNKKLENTNPIFTIDEAVLELKRLDKKVNKVSIQQSFRAKMIIENLGKTPARNLSITVDAKLPNEQWQNAFIPNSKLNLAGSQSTTIFIDFGFPLELGLPSTVHLKTTFAWFDETRKQEMTKTTMTKWTSKDNFWSHDNLE